MSGQVCKAAMCSSNLAASSTEIVNHLGQFSDSQLEEVIEVSERAIETLMEIASED